MCKEEKYENYSNLNLPEVYTSKRDIIIPFQ